MDRSYNMERYLMAHGQILNANLSPRTELLAHRLLALCGGSDGQVNLSWEEFSFMTDCYNVNAARRHLTRLSQRGIIHYSTKDFIYIGFLAWGPGGSSGGGGGADLRGYALPSVCARAGRGLQARRFGDVVCVPSAAEMAWDTKEAVEDLLFGCREPVGRALPVARGVADLHVDALPMAREEDSQSHARMLVSLLDPPPGNEEEELTDCVDPEDEPEPAPQIDEAKRTLRLLMDPQVGVDFQAARRIAGSYSFELVERHVFSWRRDLEAGKVKGPGALVHRIKAGFGAVLLGSDRRSALYRRHHPEWKCEVKEERRSYLPAEYSDIILGYGGL